MPTYEYQCTACDKRLEVEQRFTDEPLTVCPTCGGALRKVFSAVGVVFKGSGFYKTDSRSSTSKDASAKSGSESSESTTKAAEGAPSSSSGETSSSTPTSAPTASATTSSDS